MAHRVRVARSAAAFDARLPDDKEAFIAAAPTAQASAKAAAAAEQAVYQARADQAAVEHPCVKHTGAGVQGRKGLRTVTVVSLQSVFTILLYLLHCPVCKQDFYVNPFSFGCPVAASEGSRSTPPGAASRRAAAAATRAGSASNRWPSFTTASS